ncbi:aldehyde dehydrogenase family protein [Hornefia butyriciproducens]|uniref:aldehyde dehydrogenase family protein n=1 Tax=Hornefia butyriciproducens TaxID=2652293 RepID=UPI002A911894|nr:aldehyde dehydrogenase family protein [Hornefia butyriciproducens]MDY5423485.1 aldehyde dehydrogenase family protein [Hornefia butyriciproducens]
MKMIIGGQFVDASDGATREVLNPGTQEVIDTIPMATQEDVSKAVATAKEGQKIWSDVALHTRIDILKKYHALFLAHKDEFVELAAKEMGKTTAHAEAEVLNSADLGLYYIDAARSFKSEVLPVGDCANEADMNIVVREPHGVVACIVPFNFPFELFHHKVLPALVMGNAVVIKPATDTPLCNIKMAELLVEAGVEPKAVNIITGSGGKVGNWLSGNPDVDFITFTGSTEVGKTVAANAAPNLTRVSLELGGNDALIVLEDADLDYAVSEVVGGRAYCAGQVCCANKRQLVQNSIKEKFIEKMIEALKKEKPGKQFDPSSTYGPLINEGAAIEVENQIKKTVEQGGKILYGGKRFDKTFIEPTLIDTPKTADIAKDMEVFGPVWPIIGFDTVDEAIEIANASVYGLSGGVIGQDINKCMHVAKRLDSGACIVNGGGDYRGPGQPFGGHKNSGYGNEGGVYTLLEMTQIKSIIMRDMLK